MKNQSGQAPLLIILMAVAFTVSSWVLISTYTSVESNLDIRAQDERLQLEQLLMEGVDCTQTMAQIGLTTMADIATKCTTEESNQISPFVPLLNADGDLATNSYDATAGYGKMGDWSFRASCYRKGLTTCLLVHSGKPWDGTGGTQFKKRALLNLNEGWKKMPNSPWPNCCFGPPKCTLQINPSPLAKDNQGTLYLTTMAATSAKITTSDGALNNIDFPLYPGTLPVTHTISGSKTATVTVTGPSGTANCSVNYNIVDPPYCSLTVTQPATNPRIVTNGEPATLRLTWTNNSDPAATPTDARVISYHMPPAPETQMDVAYTVPLPTAGAPAKNVVVTPPVGKTDQGISGFRGYFRAQIFSAAGGSICDSPEIQVCPLSTYTGFYNYSDPSVNCTTCDHVDFSNPGAPYEAMQHGFKVEMAPLYPNLASIKQSYSSAKADYWTARTNQGSPIDGYSIPRDMFYGYTNVNEAPGLIPVALWYRPGGPGNPYVLPTQQDAFLFPNDSRFTAEKAAFTSAGYSIFSPNEFYACPTVGNYTPVSQGAGGGAGPTAPGAGPAAPGAGPSAPGAGPGPVAGPGAGPGPLAPGLACSGQTTTTACGVQQLCREVRTMRDFWDALCENCQCISLTSDLQAADVKWSTGCTTPRAPRVLDGKGYSIRNFNGNQYTGTNTTTWKSSLFEYDSTSGFSVCNLTMDNIDLDEDTPSWNGIAAGILSTNQYGTFIADNVHIRGNIQGQSYAGGIIGWGDKTVNISNSTVSGQLIGKQVGGAVGAAGNGTLVNLAAVNVTSAISILPGVAAASPYGLGSGGLIGKEIGGYSPSYTIAGSSYSGTLTSTVNRQDQIGGLVANARSLALTSSSFTGTITGAPGAIVGGIAGVGGCFMTLVTAVSSGWVSSPLGLAVGGLFGDLRVGSLQAYTSAVAGSNVLGGAAVGTAVGRARTADAHTGFSLSGSASGTGAVNAVNGNTGTAPNVSMVCP